MQRKDLSDKKTSYEKQGYGGSAKSKENLCWTLHLEWDR